MFYLFVPRILNRSDDKEASFDRSKTESNFVNKINNKTDDVSLSTSSLPIDKSPETIYLTKSEFEQWIKLHSAGKQVQTFIYNEKNLIDDIGGGETAIKWALKVVNHLFTKEELAAGM